MRNDAYKLRSGESIGFPFAILKSEGLLIFATARFESIQRILDREGLHAIRAGRGRALISSAIWQHEMSSIGSYEEFGIMLPYTEQKMNNTMRRIISLASIYFPLIGVMTKTSKTEFFVWKVIVSTDLALRSGKEIWGYPKVKGRCFVENGNSSKRYTVYAQKKKIFSLNIPKKHRMNFPLRMDTAIVTPDNNKRNRHTLRVRGFFKLVLKGIELELHDRTSGLAADMRSIDYKPFMVSQLSRFNAEFSAPIMQT